MRELVVAAWLCSCALVCAACGGSHAEPPPGVAVGSSDDGGDGECIDQDGDGYGKNCPAGNDCDDNDPSVTTQCRRCRVPNENCPCTPGTPTQSCTPPEEHVDGGVLVCSEGTRYCRDGYWSACETIGQYVFVANH